jgi:hypothetical protein
MKKMTNICVVIIILVCVESLIRVGYSPYTCAIICLQVLVLFVNNIEFSK